MSITVGIFDSQDDAENAITRLDGLGLDEGSIHAMTRGRVERGGDSILGALARAFRPGDGAVAGELTRLGLDQEEAEFYEEELDSGSMLLAVEAGNEHEDAVLAIMREANGTLRER